MTFGVSGLLLTIFVFVLTGVISGVFGVLLAEANGIRVKHVEKIGFLYSLVALISFILFLKAWSLEYHVIYSDLCSLLAFYLFGL